MLRALRDQKPVPAAAVQFTGGEPTLHPEFFRILTAAREMGFTHVQCASNGVKLAEPGFAEQAAAAGLQTVYLQFDGVDDAIYRKLRGGAAPRDEARGGRGLPAGGDPDLPRADAGQGRERRPGRADLPLRGRRTPT